MDDLAAFSQQNIVDVVEDELADSAERYDVFAYRSPVLAGDILLHTRLGVLVVQLILMVIECMVESDAQFLYQFAPRVFFVYGGARFAPPA